LDGAGLDPSATPEIASPFVADTLSVDAYYGGDYRMNEVGAFSVNGVQRFYFPGSDGRIFPECVSVVFCRLLTLEQGEHTFSVSHFSDDRDRQKSCAKNG
jgi:hypothetical protein